MKKFIVLSLLSLFISLPAKSQTFTPGFTTTSVNNQSGGAMAAGDLRGKGYDDLIVTQNDKLCILLNDGTGKFGVPTCYVAPGGIRLTGITVADFNGDGFLDIAAVGNGIVRLYAGDGQGGLLNSLYPEISEYSGPSGINSGPFAGQITTQGVSNFGMAFSATSNCSTPSAQTVLGTAKFAPVAPNGPDPLGVTTTTFPGCGYVFQIYEGKIIAADLTTATGGVGLDPGSGDAAGLYIQGGLGTIVESDSSATYWISYNTNVASVQTQFTGGAIFNTYTFHNPIRLLIPVAIGENGLGENQFGIFGLGSNGPDNLLYGSDLLNLNLFAATSGQTNPTAAVAGYFRKTGLASQDIAILDANGLTILYQNSFSGSFTPASLNYSFVTQIVGTTFTNTGTAPLTNLVVSVSPNFSETNDCPALLKVSAECNIKVALANNSATGLLTVSNPVMTATADLVIPTPTQVQPVVTSPNSTIFTVGTAGSFTITATGFPTPTLTLTGTLPSGVVFANGLLSGTPATGSAGVFQITVTATNSVQPSAVQSFTLTVNAAPVFSLSLTPSSQTATPGGSAQYTVSVNGNVGMVSLSCSSSVPCSFSSNQTASNVTMTVTAPRTATAFKTPFPGLYMPFSGVLVVSFIMIAVGSRYRRLIPVVGLALLLIGCSKGATSTGSGSTGSTGSTPAPPASASYQIVVTGSNPAGQQTATATLVVQ